MSEELVSRMLGNLHVRLLNVCEVILTGEQTEKGQCEQAGQGQMGAVF